MVVQKAAVNDVGAKVWMGLGAVGSGVPGGKRITRCLANVASFQLILLDSLGPLVSDWKTR